MNTQREYPTNVTQAQWQLLIPLLPKRKWRKGGPGRYDDFDETRTDFSRWKGIYETWQRRKMAYSEQIQQSDPADALRVQPVY